MESLLNLDREEYAITKEAYDEDNSLAYPATFLDVTGNKWTNIDADGKVSSKTYSFPGVAKGFMSTNRTMTGNYNHVDKTGETTTSMLVAVAPEPGAAASDWLISPVLPGQGIHTLEFQAKSFSSPCSADFFVEYATEDYTTEDIAAKFQPVGEKVSIKGGSGYGSAGGKWNLYSYELPADAKYVAIHFVGESKSGYDSWGDPETTYNILCLDDILLKSEPMAKPTFNVYYREDSAAEKVSPKAEGEATVKAPLKHNTDPVAENSYNLPRPAANTEFFVSSVYPQGETALSEGYRYDISTGVTDIDAESAVRVKVDGRDISATAGSVTAPVSVYAVDGKLLAAGVEKFTASEAGVYVVKANGTTVKVAVR